MDLTQVLTILEAAGIDLTGREIAEAVWLAQFLPQLPVSNSLNETQDINDTSEFVSSDFTEEAETAPSEVPERESGTDIYSNKTNTQDNTSTSNIVPAAKVRIYSGRALPNARAIARALRPLMRRIPSKIDYELDEKATAQQIAEKYLLNLRVWAPHLKPAPTRWLEVALVVDSSTSMAVWQPVANELYSLLVRQGAFRDVRMWRLDTESEMAPQLFYANNDIESAPRSYQELFDASGKRLIIVLSDCVSKAWQNRRMFSWLAKLAPRANVTILQVWPQRLWKRTILGYVNTLVSAREPALPNTQLIVEQRSAFGLSSKLLNKVSNEPKRVPIPIVALEPHAISNWARMVAGVGNVWAPAIQVEIDSSLQDNQDIDNQDIDNNIESDPRYLVEHFQATALPLTQKLAGLLASVPLQLPIMRLIQNSLLPSSEILHLSEFLTSGLIYRVQGNTDNPIFEFVEGVRDLLRRTVSISETVKALQEVGEYINEHFGEGESFAALIPNVNGVESLVLKEQTIPFAQLQAEVLESLGGIHRFTAQQLREKIVQYEEKVEKLENFNVQRQKIALISVDADPAADSSKEEIAGQNIYVRNVGEALARLGWQVDMYTRKVNAAQEEIVQHMPNCRTIRFSAGPLEFIPRDELFVYLPEFIEKFLKFQEENGLTYELVHTNYWLSSWVGMQLKKIIGCKQVHTYHSLGAVEYATIDNIPTIATKRLDVERQVLETAERIVATSPQERAHMRQLISTKGNIDIIPCGTDVQLFGSVDRDTARAMLGIDSNAKVVLYVGRFDPRKGIETLVRALRESKLYGDEKLQLIIGGGSVPGQSDGIERDRIEGIVDELRLRGCTTFAGRLSQDILPTYYAAADVCVVPSHYESFGLVAIEAMASGTPVVASDVGGLQFTVVPEETGLLAPPQDVRAFASSIDRILENPEWRDKLGEAGKHRVQRKFSWNNVVEQLSALYCDQILIKRFANKYLKG